MSNSGSNQYMRNDIPVLMRKNNIGIKELGKGCKMTTPPTIYSTVDTAYLDGVSSRVLFEISLVLGCSMRDLFEVEE